MFSPSNFHITSLIFQFHCAEVVIGQAGWIIRHPGLTLEYSSRDLPLDVFDNKHKIEYLAKG